MFENTLELLKYLKCTHSQLLTDNGLRFKDTGMGHIEFYQFGPDLIAVVIYRENERMELLIVGIGFNESMVNTAVREMVNMIKRKSLGVVARRIKVLDNCIPA